MASIRKVKTTVNRITMGMMLGAALTLTGCGKSDVKNEVNTSSQVQDKTDNSGFDLPYESFTLDNGLKVILHQDTSDPIVAISTIVHVGSSREKPGRTGFAHFFEHMSFNDSENVPKGANRKMIPELGGERNGGTWSDGTIYYEVVPKDAFDKLLWIDSDRLGFMINTVDKGTLEREKQVVKNEKRQRVDNRPYGHAGHVIKKALYPKDHPYNWTVIGDLEDLQAATLDDVREFYDKYYVPSNATMVIAGDIDLAATKEKVKLWFGEIKSGPEVASMEAQPVTLSETKKLYHEDNFAKLPEIRLTFPTVESFHKDAYALDALGEILSSGKQAPLYVNIVEKQKLAPGAYSWHRAEEIAGTFTILVRGNPGTNLNDIYAAIQASFDEFEKNGFSESQLTKIKAEQETSFFYEIESVLGKAQKLGEYNEFAGSPDFIKQDINNITAVTAEDVKNVFNKYIKDKHHIVTSFVPKGEVSLAVSGSKKADIVEEVVEQGAEEEFVENDAIQFTKTQTKHDRSEPPLSELPTLTAPQVWQTEQANGLTILGIEQNELPIVNFSLTIQGGQLLDDSEKLGTANLVALMMNEGTKSKTPKELEEAIGLLGASLRVMSDRESITVRGRSLVKNFDKTVGLLGEMLLEPRWDPSEFERLKQTQLTSIKQAKGDAQSIARNAYFKLLYPENHAASSPLGGTEETVNAISLDDLKAYYIKNMSPKLASFQVAGDVSQQQVVSALSVLKDWKGEDLTLPVQPQVVTREKPSLYFIDLPDAKQSVIMVGKAVVPAQHPDFYPIVVANNRLGGGMSARLAQTLRIQKGYTYGAYSYIRGASYQSPFIASSQVRTNVTLESLDIFKDLIDNYQSTYSEDDLDVTKNMIVKGNARKFETLGQQLNVLENISRYGWSDDYISERQEYVTTVTLEDVHNTINTHLKEQNMFYVVVGDAKTQLARMKEFGYGEPVLLDVNANPIEPLN